MVEVVAKVVEVVAEVVEVLAEVVEAVAGAIEVVAEAIEVAEKVVVMLKVADFSDDSAANDAPPTSLRGSGPES